MANTAISGSITTTPGDGSVTSAKLNSAVLTGLTSETTIADADLMLVDDGGGGTLRKMSRGNVFATGGAVVKRSGNPSTWDFTLASFTTDGTPKDLDLSGIVPVGTKAVFFSMYVVDDVSGKSIQFYDPDDSNKFPAAWAHLLVAGAGSYFSLGPIGVDSNRYMKYQGDNTAFTAINLIVTGWII